MATAPPPNHDPSLAPTGAPAPPQPPPGSQAPPGMPGDAALPNAFGNLASEQVMAILSKIPGFGNMRDSAAAEALSNLAAQASFQPHHPGHIPHPHQPPPPYHVVHPHQPPHPHGLGNEPGPSTHPRGPPDLGQLAQSALQNPPPGGPPVTAPTMRTRSQDAPDVPPPLDGDASSGANGDLSPEGTPDNTDIVGAVKSASGGRRGGRAANMSNDEWTRQRKDNHKEVERRRRGNINEGINELGRIVPNGSGEKAKGAILSRAVQYIHHLKENEARNIEKWTLEKLLMDQAMGDLQAQLEEMRRMWDEERIARQRAESELDVLRGLQQGLPLSAAAAAAAAAVASANANAPMPPGPAPAPAAAPNAPSASATTPAPSSAPVSAPAAPPLEARRSKSPETSKDGNKRERDESDGQDAAAPPGESESEAKRQRVE